jgi:hypothetical protein
MRRRLEGLKERAGLNGPGITIAVIALVLALAGGAFAAAGLTGKQKKEVIAIAKKYAGKPGGPGATGPQGPAGPQGAVGAKGDKGDPGGPGTPGKDGTSVVPSPEPIGSGNCGGNGGSKFVTGPTTTFACNGAEGPEGPEGPEGSPWVAGGTLPPTSAPGCEPDPLAIPPREGCSETGAWAFTGTTADTAGIRVPLSFPIWLGAALAGTNVHWQEEANFTDFDEAGAGEIGCKGVAATPRAPSGHLCIYINAGENPVANTTFEGIFRAGGATTGANRSGASLQFTAPTGDTFSRGTFAVTG